MEWKSVNFSIETATIPSSNSSRHKDLIINVQKVTTDSSRRVRSCITISTSIGLSQWHSPKQQNRGGIWARNDLIHFAGYSHKTHTPSRLQQQLSSTTIAVIHSHGVLMSSPPITIVMAWLSSPVSHPISFAYLIIAQVWLVVKASYLWNRTGSVSVSLDGTSMVLIPTGSSKDFQQNLTLYKSAYSHRQTHAHTHYSGSQTRLNRYGATQQFTSHVFMCVQSACATRVWWV